MSEPTTPVVWLTMISGHASRIAETTAVATFGSQDGRWPRRGSRRRKWTWTTLAPSSNARLASRRHLLGRYRRRIDGGVGQHAGQRAGEDSLVHLQASPSATMTNRSSRACVWPPRAAAAWVMTPSIGERMEYCNFIASTVASACPRRT